jgi:hypothetical protein
MPRSSERSSNCSVISLALAQIARLRRNWDLHFRDGFPSQIDWPDFTPLPALAGAALIGLAAAWLTTASRQFASALA